ncbi:MAG: hypothetical protein P8J59_10900 [Phycisphaerales bacterium]|jgi:hypothetical protein|nr:hypothetical protein [Phycisphaerales bacterium]
MSENNTDPELLIPGLPEDDPEPGVTWFISLISLVLMVITVLASVAMYFGFVDGEVDRKIVDRPAVELQELRLTQQEQLTEYEQYEIEDAEGNKLKRIRIPISKAMESIIAGGRASADSTESDDSGAIASR